MVNRRKNLIDRIAHDVAHLYGGIAMGDLGTRVHSCPGCGLVMNRDVNAAINILIRLRNTARPFSRP